MKNFVIQKVNKEQYIILSTSYVSPLDDIDTLQSDLKKLSYSGNIVIDLLLCNGISDNRYIEVYFDGNKFDFSTFSVINEVDNNIRKESRCFYMKNKQLLNRGVLLDSHKYIVQNGVI